MSNMDLSYILSFPEVGNLSDILELLNEDLRLNPYNIYVYFKKTNERWQLNYDCIDENTILVVVADENGSVPKNISSRVHIVFKTYLTENSTMENVWHLPVGPPNTLCERHPKPLNKRSYRVFFSGNLHIGRKNFYKFFTKAKWAPFFLLHRMRGFFGENFSYKFDKSYIQFTRKFNAGLDPNRYSEYLYNSRVVLCPPGNPGVETLRHYEAMKAGCIIISEILPQVECFTGSPIIQITNWADVDNLVSEILNDDNRMNEQYNKMISWWSTYCSPIATVNYISKKTLQL